MVELSDGIKTFNIDLKAAIEKFGTSHDKLLQALALRLFENIVRRTPVGDPTYWQNKPPPGYVGGYARNNWRASVGSPDEGPPAAAPDGSGSSSLASVTAGVGQLKAGQTIYIQNAVPYIQALENGTASPRQAPNGMVGVTLAEAAAFYNDLGKASTQT